MKTLKTVIVDDERLARQELKRMLKKFSQVEVVGEFGDPEEAVEFLNDSQIDLVFLDIEMPEVNGFDLLDKLEPPLPYVVFATAFNEFATKAFEVNALDYILKPIEEDRLSDAVSRAESACRERSVAASENEKGESADHSRLTRHDRVYVREGDRCWFVALKEISLFESQGNYTVVQFNGEKPLLLRSLTAMSERLDPEVFFRANRSQIINLDFVDKVQPWFSNSLKVTLIDGVEVEMSRRQSKAFREMTSL